MIIDPALPSMVLTAYILLVWLQAQAPSLLDIAFDDVANGASALPPADYLPALERQKELEAQLLKQQVCWHTIR